jgi:HAE1 family hydrophobic/amphiphilic exporter-1
MKLIEHAIRRPVAVLSVVLMVMLMGWLALTTIPIQLTPDVRKPLIIVQTSWRGAPPIEVEREIVIRQEEALKGLEGLERMEARANRGRAQIVLEFGIDTNRDRAILLINNRLTQVTGLPEEADEPRIITRDTDDNPIAWFTVETTAQNTRPIYQYGDFVDDVIADRLERVDGVALVNFFGGDERELRVVVDPRKLALYKLTITDLSNALRGTNVNIAAGEVDEGKRRYTVRTESELNTLQRVKDVILRSDRDAASGRLSRVTVADISTVSFGYKRPGARIRNMGKNAIVVNAVLDTGANMIKVMDGMKAAVKELNRELLPQAGLQMTQVYDATIYVNSAIELVTQNIWIGGGLAALILFIFLRSFGATAVVSLAIPVSIVGSFVAMAALGRSINVISMAGIAFAVGMVVDAAIVVLENIYRHREMGRTRFEAARRGANEVWGAIMVSAMTTIVVFAPILLMNLVVGQLFRDIAVALSVAVFLSLIVSITVVPALANKLLSEKSISAADDRHIPIIDSFARGFARVVTGYVGLAIRSRVFAVLTVLIICGVAGASTWLFLPKLEYLPDGNRNLVRAITSPPPGYNLATMNEIAEEVENAIKPLWAKPGEKDDPNGPPKIERFWFVARTTSNFIAASAVDPARARELKPYLEKVVFREPGTFGFVSQSSLFGRGFGGSRIIELDITGPELEDLLAIARDAVQVLNRALPRNEGNSIRPRPGLELGGPEVRVIPDLLKLADVGLTARDLAQTIDVFNDGARIAEVTVGSKRVDLTAMGPDRGVKSTQGIGNLPVVTRGGFILPVSALSKITVTEGPTQVRHLERQRTITIQVRPTEDIPLEEAIEIVKNQVIKPMVAAGLPPGVFLRLSGTADELKKTWEAMVLNLTVAVLVVYLVMAILFESFLFPLIIMFSVPLATAGGVLGLSLLNFGVYMNSVKWSLTELSKHISIQWFQIFDLFSIPGLSITYPTAQQLDMLTLLGFVILIGTVVNNAILLVHQTLNHVRVESMLAAEAIAEATRNRIRPIFMSTLTSVFGMLPLVVTPGAGSELYRGLGSVVLGGLALSAVLTLLIIPPLLTLLSPVLARQRGSMQHEATVTGPAVASAAE